MIFYILVGGDWIGAAAVSRAAAGSMIPDMVFYCQPEKLVGMFEALGPAGREAYLVMNAVNFIFAATYSVFFFITSGWLAKRLFPSRPAFRLIGFVGVAGEVYADRGLHARDCRRRNRLSHRQRAQTKNESIKSRRK